MNPNTLPARRRRRWPLMLLAAPAAVAIWSGWVALGGMCGFGLVHPLPGIADQFTLNTAITLPIGVEAYSAYALGTWLSGTVIPARARRFAAWSALGGLILGLVGQVIYHVLEALSFSSAPIPIVVFVSSLPVLALGAAATLHHLTDDQLTDDPAADEPSTTAADRVGETPVLETPSWDGMWLTTPDRAAIANQPGHIHHETGGSQSPAPAANPAESADRDVDVVGTSPEPNADGAKPRQSRADEEMMVVVREVAAELDAEGINVTRRAAAARIRERVGSCSNERVNDLLRQLRAERADHIGQLESVAS
jgi:hypothetical protein